jgi:co-chaperonin GroES (HSP10)
MALDIAPVEGFVALQIVDDETEEERELRKNRDYPSDSYNEAIYAIVVGVGPKAPAGVKKGATVLVRKYARDGLRIDDDTVLVETYCIAAVVK